MRRYRTASALAILMWLVGCTATFDIAAPPNDEPIYAMLYPFYAELCAVSQIRKKPGFGVDTSGGPGGHAVFYLNGVCRDRDAGYPTLVICAPGTPATEQGVGLSVNAHFQNANWVATEGRDFFFQGDLTPGERLTPAAYSRTLATAEAKGIYDGIVFHDEVFDDMSPGMDRHDFMYEVSVATDYAVAFGRDRYCARVPVTRAQMVKVVDYLNGINAMYRDGKKVFVWNVVQNNCSHLAHNALATAGIWDDWPTDRFIAISAFDFPVPKNEFVNLMWRTNDMDKLALAVGSEAFANAKRDAIETATVFTSSGGDGDTIHNILDALASAQIEVSPTRFHNSVHNAPSGYWSIAVRSVEPTTSICVHDASFSAGLLEAAAQATVDKRAVGLIAYDLPYPKPLNAARPIGSMFGVGLVMTPAPSEATFASLTIGLGHGNKLPTAMAEPRLEAMRLGNPAARSLPLLEALARRIETNVVLEYLGDNAVTVSIVSTPSGMTA
jgi:hypothetical protein